jgi:hypothetical protein
VQAKLNILQLEENLRTEKERADKEKNDKE